MNQRESTHAGDILVVDDAPANLSLLESVLTERGYRVRPTPSGAIALEAAEAEPPDLILLDIRMPHMDGFEVCRRLKQSERLRGVPVIFLSALSDTVDKVKAFSMGGVDYVTKPFQIEELEARVETHLSLRRLQLQLEESYVRLKSLEQMRHQLVQMIVHDLTSPIAAVHFNAMYVHARAGLQGKEATAIDAVLSSCGQLNRMTLDMLEVATSDAASIRPRLEPFDLRELLDDVLAGARDTARRVGISLIVNVAGDVPAVIVDRELIQRIVWNLLDNALKYAPKDSEVRIEAARAGTSEYSIRVRDQGPGVPPADRDRIFDPYVRLERDARKHVRTSRGLGLAFCRLAVDAHGGRIWAEDNPPQGTTFVIQLPIDPTSVGSKAPTWGSRRLPVSSVVR